MQHVTKYLNLPLIRTHLEELLEERTELKRRQNALRQQTFRMRKLIESHNRLELNLKAN